MGRRRKKVIKLPRRKLPTIFLCPICGETAISVLINKDANIAEVRCGKCNAGGKFPVAPADQSVDIYCKFTDKFYAENLERG